MSRISITHIFCTMLLQALVCFACQQKAWQIPSELEIKSEHLTPEQASKALFGNYDPERHISTWLIPSDRNFLNQFKDYTCKLHPDTSIALDTRYAAADISTKHQVTLAYTTSFRFIHGIECEHEFGVLSLFEFKKNQESWSLQQLIHLPIDLQTGAFHETFGGVRSRQIGKGNPAFIIELNGGGLVGSYEIFYQIIAKVNGKYKSVLRVFMEDRYCSYQEMEDGESEQVCGGQSATMKIEKCEAKFCPIKIIEGEPVTGDHVSAGVYRFNGEGYVKQ